MKRHALCLGILSLLIVTAPVARATTIEASDNATVQPGGPRSGTSGKAFFNVEGSNNGTFASYGVVDFNLAGLGLDPVADVENVVLKLTESNAGFSLNGPMSFYFTASTGINIQPGTSPAAYQSGNNGLASVGGTFGSLTYLGSGNYTNTSNGTVESFPLSFSGAALTGFVDAINNGTTLRLIVTPDSASTAATYAGNTNFTYAGPTLTFDAVTVPEPSTLVLAPLSMLLAALGRRRFIG